MLYTIIRVVLSDSKDERWDAATIAELEAKLFTEIEAPDNVDQLHADLGLPSGYKVVSVSISQTV